MSSQQRWHILTYLFLHENLTCQKLAELKNEWLKVMLLYVDLNGGQ